MQKSIKKNLFYQFLFQGIKIVIPIILIPIISRALGTTGIGIYSFTSSIAEYFILFSGLGILLYGNREVAIVRDDLKKLSTLFSELFFLTLISTTISLIAYGIIVFLFLKQSYLYYIVHMLHIICVIFDVTWFFMGLEEFKKISIVNIATQIIVFVLIVVSIHSPSDLLLYMFIKAVGDLAGFLMIWNFALKRVTLERIHLFQLKKHLKHTMLYFIPQMGVVLYSTLTKTFLGIMTTNHHVGIYTNATYLTTTITTLLTTINLILLPRISHLFSHKKIKEIMEIVHLSVHTQLFFSIPAALGISAISKSFVPWFFGPGFEQLQTLLPFLSPVVIILPMGMVFTHQYLLPLGQTKHYTFSVLGGALMSILLNSFLIPSAGLIGAVVSTLIVESFITFYRFWMVRKQTNYSFNYLLILRIIAASLGMYASILFFTQNSPINPVTTVFQVALGGVLYILFSFLFKIPYIYQAKNTVSKYFRKVKPHKENIL